MTFANNKRTLIAQQAALLADFPGQKLPEPTDDTHAKADQIANGTVFFYQSRPVQVGLSDIDWSGGHIKHQEWPAQLNRFFMLGPLASAFGHTHDERFARAARSYIEDWLNRPGTFDTGDTMRPGDNTLNMSIRLGTSMHHGWAGVLPTFLASDAFDDALLERMFASISSQAAFLSKHLTGWGNWRISQLDALVFVALRFPFLDNAEDLLSVGLQGMRNALATQFLPDGVHIERTPGYHGWMTRVAFNYHRLASLFDEVDAHVHTGRLLKSFDYMAQSALAALNDAKLVLTEPDESRGVAARRQARQLLCPDQADQLPPLEQTFPDAGQVFVRSSWKPNSDYLAFDASTWGGGHTHLSRLAFSFRSGGRLLIADPGILSYEMTDPLGPFGKSTPAHSTLNVNGWNQSDTDARLLGTHVTPETVLIHAEYAGGYWKGTHYWGFDQHECGTFGWHERLLFWVRDQYLIVLDTMESDPGTTVHNCWQTGPMRAGSPTLKH